MAGVVKFTSAQADESSSDKRHDENVFWQLLGKLAKEKEVSRDSEGMSGNSYLIAKTHLRLRTVDKH